MKTREKAQQTSRTAHSHQESHTEGTQKEHQNQALSTRHASIYRTTNRPQQTPSRNRSKARNRKQKYLHTLVCLPNGFATAPGGASRGVTLGGAS